MNARISTASNIAATSLESDERWRVVQHILTSPVFIKAPRMRALLSFLMIRKLSGMEDSINEYAIGIEVFRRDARDYDTTIDPVVRVQMGRLRERLAQYYALYKPSATVQLAIPAGSYVPVMAAVDDCRPAKRVTIQLAPVRMLSQGGDAGEFVSGLEEELALQLFQRFGSGRAGGGAGDYRIEISIRVEQGRARASVRLIAEGTGQTVWLNQCDRHGAPGIGLQEELAQAICHDLQSHVGSAAD